VTLRVAVTIEKSYCDKVVELESSCNQQNKRLKRLIFCNREILLGLWFLLKRGFFSWTIISKNNGTAKLYTNWRAHISPSSPSRIERKDNGREWNEINEKKLRYRTKRFLTNLRTSLRWRARQSLTRDDLVVGNYEWEFTNNHRSCVRWRLFRDNRVIKSWNMCIWVWIEMFHASTIWEML